MIYKKKTKGQKMASSVIHVSMMGARHFASLMFSAMIACCYYLSIDIHWDADTESLDWLEQGWTRKRESPIRRIEDFGESSGALILRKVQTRSLYKRLSSP